MDRPRIVCLCGSTRFRESFELVNRLETLDGRIVLSVGLYGHQEGIDMTGPVKAVLDELHLRKIDLADEVVVVNPITRVCCACGGLARAADATRSGESSACCGAPIRLAPYFGESTRREIDYAKSKGKPVRYWVNPE